MSAKFFWKSVFFCTMRAFRRIARRTGYILTNFYHFYGLENRNNISFELERGLRTCYICDVFDGTALKNGL